MRTQIAACFAIAALVGLNIPSANAVSKPTSSPHVKSTVEKVACRRGYKSYADCMRTNGNNFCNKMCS
jgi:hypothetical protein